MPKMSQVNRTMGTLQPILYFENFTTGEISMPPSDEIAYNIKSEMARRGFDLKEAGTLREIDKLQHKMQDWEYKVGQRAMERDDQLRVKVRAGTRQRLIDRMVSSSTTPWERDYIKAYLMLADDKREKWRKEHALYRNCYFALRENNSMQPLKDAVESIPEMKDTVCVRCGKFRRMRDSRVCFTCAGG